MENVPIRLGMIAGAIVASSLVAGLFVYSSVPAATNAALTSSPSSRLTSSSPRVVSSSARMPFDNPFYLGSGGCSAGYQSNGTAYAEPCSGYSVDQGQVFNCSAQAATSTGCTRPIWSYAKTMPMELTVNGSLKQSQVPVLNNTMTVWYPHVDKTGNKPSWANCMYHVQHGSRGGGSYGFCIMVNSTAFVVSTPGAQLGPE